MKSKSFLIILIFITVVLLGSINLYAASAASISISNSSPKVGENITVTLNIPAGYTGGQANVSITFSDGTTSSGRNCIYNN